MRTAEQLLRDRFSIPEAEIPQGRWLELPRRGRTWLTDLPGPTPEAPSVVLLHAVGCTGLLTWYPVLAELNKRYRVVTFDQRWHGQGITSERFLISDCADDVAVLIDELDLVDPVVAGFSMGSIVAQRVWRQHPDAIGGLVLAATTDHFRSSGRAAVFHAWFELSMGILHGVARSRALSRAARAASGALGLEETDMGQWALGEFRSTSPWAVGQAVASLGRFHSTPWLPMVDVPTAVVVTAKDRLLPPDGQRRVASLIPGATVHEADCGHAGCVLEAEAFLPVFIQAVNTTTARVRDARLIGARG
jgi:pimeloyl-ACP methyl ester carboxylesterase